MLELRDVTCVRGGRDLFTGLNCQVPPGKLLRVRGANGAGKTSLLRMVCGLLAPGHGEILWRGERISDLAEEFGRQMIFVGHAAALKDDLTAIENLQMACLLGALDVSAVQARQALAVAGLPDRAQVPARELSQGQRRRVALARLVLGRSSPLWVLDEPFNALDTAATQWLCGLIAGHVAANGSVILTSHQEVALDDSGDLIALTL